jgi:cytochrome c peroxidase
MRTRTLLGPLAAIWAGAVAGLLLTGDRPIAAAESGPNFLTFKNAAGQLRTLTVNGAFDFENPFFQDLGTNGRRCVTCHQPSAAWTITPANVQARFADSNGTDPIFTSNDGSNCEGATPTSIAERAAASSLLMTRGLIRVGLDLPVGAEFTIDRVDDPYRCGAASNDASLYRRPLPSSNLRFLSAVMWDGRESSANTTILEDLAHQANDATRGHAQAAMDLTPAQAQHIVAFETGVFSAQDVDRDAGNLNAQGAAGGPMALTQQPFFLGINDPVGLNPSGNSFDPNAFTLFNAWIALNSSTTNPFTDARLAVARGQQIFNTKPMSISGVGGLNGETFSSGVTVPVSFVGTCTICHDTPNAGNHSVKAPLNIGLTDSAIAPYLPVYTLRNLTTRRTIRTTDPGRAMITGKWKDVGKFKGPVLRALAARAPYFHNGSAAGLADVVEFYNIRFGIGFTAQEKADLVAFLRAL